MRRRGSHTALRSKLASRAVLIALCVVVSSGSAACAAQRGTIGAIVAQRSDGRLFVRDVPAGLAADKAGLRPDDEVLLVDGADVRAMTAEQVHAALSGNVGDPVSLTVVRGDEVLRVTLRRTVARKYGGAGQSAEGGDRTGTGQSAEGGDGTGTGPAKP
jgi:C-terminal processing protease CtpA/Prc